MKHIHVTVFALFLFFFLLAIGIVTAIAPNLPSNSSPFNQPNTQPDYGQDTPGNYDPSQYPQQPIQTRQGYGPMPQGNDFGMSEFNFGMPSWSLADPEYVAQQKMVEGMTTAYNWIALNSTRFANGCKTDKTALVSELSNVIKQSQETSVVCARFATDAQECNPDIFCSKFSAGNLPMPPEVRYLLKRAGYAPEKLKIEDVTEEMILKICVLQGQSELSSRNQMIDSVKEKLRNQLSSFKSKCEEFKQRRISGIDIRLPDFGQLPPMPQQGMQQGMGEIRGCPEERRPSCRAEEHPECFNGTWNCIALPSQGAMRQGCPGLPPDCSPAPPAYCANNNWVCPVQATPQEPIQTPVPEPAPIQEQPQITEPAPAPEPEPAPAPAPEPTPEPTPTVQTAVQNPIVKAITGFIVAASGGINLMTACGDGVCEWDYGENEMNCPDDCNPRGGPMNTGTWQQPGQPMQPQQPQPWNQPMQPGQPTGYGTPVQQGPMQPYNGYGQPSAPGGYGPSPGQGSMPGIGMSPERLCELSDDEILEMYTGQMVVEGPSQQEFEYGCKMNSSRILNEMSRYKLEIARCRADSALDCEAKQQAVASCNEIKDNPEKAADIVVSNMCRRFGTPAVSQAAKTKLYNVANKWFASDPALANQLGDTAEKTVEDQKKLDAVSVLFGNGDYASKIKERSEKLKAVKERLVSKGVTDTETLSILEAQATELETEANKFGNAFDITRWGYFFRPAPQ